MSDLAQLLSFSPRTIDDERRIYRATPVAWTESSVVLLNEYGATLCKSDREATPLDLPEADEVVLSPDGVIYACWFERDSFRVQAYQFKTEAFNPTGQPCVVNVRGLHSEDLVVLGVPGGVELWLDTAERCQRIWTISNGCARRAPASVVQRPKGDLLFSSGKIVGFAEDLGVKGTFLNIVDVVSQAMWTVRSAFAFTALGRVLAISISNPTDDDTLHGLHVFADGQATFLETDGPVLEAGGDSTRVVMSVFTGSDAQLREITQDDIGGLAVRHLDALDGYKALSLNGSLYTARGFTDTLTVAFTPSRSRLLQSTRPTTAESILPSMHGEYVVSRAPGRATGAVIHFHGGPEGYEVPEGRLFGLPQWCNAHGLDWIGVNYQGSLMPNRLCTRSAWHRWRSAMQEDLLGAVELTAGPLVLAGWSFGATLALALGSSTERVKGLLLGATTGDLAKHVEHAATIDPGHRDWFARRFDLGGDDAKFFSGVNGFNADLQVLEIHGEDDMNCPIYLANEVAECWKKRGNPWERVWLPGRGHFASIPEDAELISESARGFLTRVLLETV